MKTFGEYIKENITPFAQTEKGFVGIDNGPVRDNINMLLSQATLMPFSTPYHALEVVRRILASYHIFIPQTKFLDGDSGHEVFMINQFGDKYGYDSNSNIVSKTTSPYHIYFEYAMTDSGKFDVFSEVVTEDELQEILSDVEDEVNEVGVYGDKDAADSTFDSYKADNAINEASYSKNELKKGAKDEKKEHGLSSKEAVKTAKDHLTKVDPKYYSKLDKIGLEEEDPCWKGYEQIGMKKKGGKKVPNCVPVNEVSYHLARNAMEKAKRKGKHNQANKFKKYSEKKDHLQARYDDLEYKGD